MLWKTHSRISNEVLRRLRINLSSDVYSRFKEGIIAPDKWGDYPHHYGKDNDIIMNLQHARQYYLNGNMQDAFYYLGVALHYILDSYTSVISYNSPHNQEWHQNYEQSIEDSDFVSNVDNTIQYYFKDDFYQLSRYSSIAKSLSESILGKNDTLRVATLMGTKSEQTGKPKVDLNLALKACLVVTESILSSKSNSELNVAIEQSFAYHETLLHKAELAIAQEIIETAMQVENLRSKRINKSGIGPKLKNCLLTLRVRIKESHLNSKYKGYLQKRHLFKVSADYKEATGKIIKPHIGWYTFTRPELKIDIVKNELLTLEEAYREFAVNEATVRQMAKDNRLKTYLIKDKVVVKRQMLKQISA